MLIIGKDHHRQNISFINYHRIILIMSWEKAIPVIIISFRSNVDHIMVQLKKLFMINTLNLQKQLPFTVVGEGAIETGAYPRPNKSFSDKKLLNSGESLPSGHGFPFGGGGMFQYR